jgi:hypothetical protein
VVSFGATFNILLQTFNPFSKSCDCWSFDNSP